MLFILKLRESKFFVKESNSYFNRKKTKYFKFDLQNYIKESEDQKSFMDNTNMF